MNKDKEIKRKEFEHLKRIGVYKLKGKCSICDSEETTCFHHIVPLSMPRGTNSTSNVIEVCYECHREIHGNLKMLTEVTEEQKEILRKAQTKMIKVKYDFSSVDESIIGEEECKGNNASIDIINNVIKRVNDAGTYMRWAQTNPNTYASYGARKTIHTQSKLFNNEYKLFRKDYEHGYIEIYIPHKRGIA